ncbi:hypothetical protein ACFLWU_00345 [Chloroflexota bacterium]
MRVAKEIGSGLHKAGIEATGVTGNNSYLDKTGVTLKKAGYKIKIAFDVRGKYFDYIFYQIVGTRSSTYKYLMYIIIGNIPEIDMKKRKLLAIRNTDYDKHAFLTTNKENGKTINVKCAGDQALTQEITNDYLLTEKLVKRCQSDKKIQKIFREIFIYYDPDYGYAAISHLFGSIIPTAEHFEIMNMIARHIKSAWFGR